MQNRIIGILILTLYFANYHICELIYPDGGMDWLKVRYSIYSIIILLALKYKSSSTFVYKLFNAIVINNIYVILCKNEFTYTHNDVLFIGTFILIQYIKINAKFFARIFDCRLYRTLANYFNDNKEKK